MGYTHYWFRPEEIEQTTFDLIAADAEALYLTADIPIAYEYDDPDSLPVFSPNLINFDGVGDDRHETFYFPRVQAPEGWMRPERPGEVFNFCKTAAKPYDTLVCAVLLAAKHQLGDSLRVSSDGTWQEWEEGRALYAQTFPDRPIENPLKRS